MGGEVGWPIWKGFGGGMGWDFLHPKNPKVFVAIKFEHPKKKQQYLDG